jgi:hypothetical protein
VAQGRLGWVTFFVARRVYTRLAIFIDAMYLLYLDESGNPDGQDDRYFILRGVAVFEREVYWIDEEVNKLAKTHFPGSEIEFHAQAIAGHREEPWRSCPAPKRKLKASLRRDGRIRSLRLCPAIMRRGGAGCSTAWSG